MHAIFKIPADKGYNYQCTTFLCAVFGPNRYFSVSYSSYFADLASGVMAGACPSSARCWSLRHPIENITDVVLVMEKDEEVHVSRVSLFVFLAINAK